MEPSPAKGFLEKGLEGLRPCVAGTLEDQIFTLVEDIEERLVLFFGLERRSGWRIKSKNIGPNGSNPFARTMIAKQVKDKVFEKATRPPSKELVPYIIASQLQDEGLPKNRLGKYDKKRLRVAHASAQDYLDERRHERGFLEADMEDAIETNQSICEPMADIKLHDRFRRDPFKQAYDDEKKGVNEGLLFTSSSGSERCRAGGKETEDLHD